ncbi:AAA family ATPase [Pelagicoccus mobilis]|uniref:AAA family ATPase n=1 Tax=Pelagicoccus mobilis TaxID=415221 RepID=A0A934S2G7_9BACT|nr:AAA family ATPase [Pelagicoccus mobilis]MBK1879869.1 AAA family ATPase [Pelagicoccus mobilis]
MPRQLTVRLLGEFSLLLDGSPYTAIDTIRLRGLLAYLLVKRGTALQRSRLAFEFWPDSTEKQAKTNLRHLLHELRKKLPDADSFIEANAKTIEWRTDGDVDLDVDVFEGAMTAALLACKRGDAAMTTIQFEKAVAAYGGDFLAGHYEAWADELREELRRKYIQSLEGAVSCHESKRNYVEALSFCQTLRQVEPTREKTYCSLMRLYSLSGDRAKALQSYRDCEMALRRELDVSPSERTEALHRKLMRDEPLETKRKSSTNVANEPELPLQGRLAEWETLKQAWAEAESGRAHLIVLVGEAGIGKSRLAEELFVELAREGVATCKTRSYSAEGRLAYAPVCQWMRSSVLKPSLSEVEPVWLTEIARVMPEIRSEFPDLPESSAEQGNWQRHLLFEALSRVILAKDEPLMLLLDDMQWTDQESLEWLRYLLRFAPRGRFLITGTIREEELAQDHPLRHLMLELRRDGQLSEILLGPLSREEASDIAAGVAGRELSAREASQLYEATEGNPLFVVESVRAGLRGEKGASLDSYEGLDLVTVPPKVHAVFATRLAQLSGEALEFSRIAAVFGRAFTIEMLLDVSGAEEEETIRLLDELWEKRIIREQEAGLYDFTHDKLREVTYEQISTPKRRMLHRKSSDVLEKFFADDLNSVSAQLASHYEEAGQVSKAIVAYQNAGRLAKELNASREAIRLFEKALALLKTLPSSRERLELELDLNMDLGTCQVSEYGYHAPGVQHIYERSQELCSQLDRSTTPPVLRALALYNLTTGRLHKTLELGELLGTIYDETNDNVLLVESEYVLGVANFWLGNFAEAADRLQNSIDCYDPDDLHAHLTLYAQDPKAICVCRLGWCRYVQGREAEAIELVKRSVEIGSELKHPHTEGYVLYFSAQVLVEAGEYDLATEFIERFDDLKTDHQLGFWAVRSEMLKGYMGVVRYRDPVAMELFETNFRRCVDLKPTISLSLFLVYYAEACVLMSLPKRGLEVLEQYRSAAAESDETFYNAELARKKGELLELCGEAAEESEALYREALDLARAQGGTVFERKAADSLRRLRDKQGNRSTAVER